MRETTTGHIRSDIGIDLSEWMARGLLSEITEKEIADPTITTVIRDMSG